MKRNLFILCAVLTAGAVVPVGFTYAQDMPQPAEAGDVKDQPAGAAVATNAVATNAVEQVPEIPIELRLRDPFWPIGYVPKRTVVRIVPTGNGDGSADVKPDWVTAERQLRSNVSGIVIDNTGKKKPFAIANGNIVTLDENLTLELSGFVYTWKVEAITKDGLRLTHVRVKLKDR